jgi:hypothetical protein
MATTVLPPPLGRPATAHLSVIAEESRSASLSASRQDGYRAIRHPPIAWPRMVECTATMTGTPDLGPRWIFICSWRKGVADGVPLVPPAAGRRVVADPAAWSRNGSDAFTGPARAAGSVWSAR